jgi:hypothetical protein
VTPSGSRESILFQRGLHNGTAPVLYGLPSGTNLTDALNFPLAMRSAHRPVRSQQFCECLGCLLRLLPSNFVFPVVGR